MLKIVCIHQHHFIFFLDRDIPMVQYELGIQQNRISLINIIYHFLVDVLPKTWFNKLQRLMDTYHLFSSTGISEKQKNQKNKSFRFWDTTKDSNLGYLGIFHYFNVIHWSRNLIKFSVCYNIRFHAQLICLLNLCSSVSASTITRRAILA